MTFTTLQKKMTIEHRRLHDCLYILRQMRKPKCQRRSYWSIREKSKNLNHPNMEKFIEFMFEHYTIGHEGLCIHRKLTSNQYDYSVYDGNNRINAILYFLDNPYKIFPEKYEEIDEFIDDINVLTEEDKQSLKDKIHSFGYKTLYDDCTNLERLFGLKFVKDDNGEDTRDEIDMDEQPIILQIFDKIPGQKKRGMRRTIERWKYNFGHRIINGNKEPRNLMNVTILFSFYENYNSEDLAQLFIANKYKGTKMTDNDLYAAKLCDTKVNISDNTIKHELLSIIRKYYACRNNDYEQVAQYTLEDNENTINAFDFIVSFVDYCSEKYKLFNTFLETNNNCNSFFVLYQVLYKDKKDISADLKNEDFSNHNINDFITRICHACRILQECVDSLYPRSCNEQLFNSSANKRIMFNSKLYLQVLLFSIIMKLKQEDHDEDIMKYKIKVILYYSELYNRIGNNKEYKDIKERLVVCHPLNNTTKGHWKEWMYQIKNNPNILFDKIKSTSNDDTSSCNLTPKVMEELIFTLLKKQSKMKVYTNKKKRRTLTMLDKFLMGHFYFTSMPLSKQNEEFSNEHIVCFSTHYDPEVKIDIDRLGNLFPTKKQINNDRKINDLSIYYQHDTFEDFSKYLKPILYSNDEYHQMIKYVKHHSNNCPTLANVEKYNEICDRNEKHYINNFITSIFEEIN